MSTKAKIKVIKRNSQPEVKAAKPAKVKTTQQTARDMVSTVSSWVSEFQQKRSTDAKKAFEMLFEVQNPNGCANC